MALQKSRPSKCGLRKIVGHRKTRRCYRDFVQNNIQNGRSIARIRLQYLTPQVIHSHSSQTGEQY